MPKRCYYFLCNSREECGQRRHICPIFDTSIPGADEYDGRNALGCRDLFCEKYFEANPGKNVIYATYYGTPRISDAEYRALHLRRCLRGLSYATFFASRFCAA